jgi:hypothetical protein
VSGVRFQVSGVRFQVSGVRIQVSGVRFQVSGTQVSGVRCQKKLESSIGCKHFAIRISQFEIINAET